MSADVFDVHDDDRVRCRIAGFLAQQGVSDPRFGPRARWVLAHCWWRLGQRNAAAAVAGALVRDWVSSAIPDPPAVHPRTSVPRSDLVELVAQVARGPGYDALLADIAAVGDDLDVDRDFF